MIQMFEIVIWQYFDKIDDFVSPLKATSAPNQNITKAKPVHGHSSFSQSSIRPHTIANYAPATQPQPLPGPQPVAGGYQAPAAGPQPVKPIQQPVQQAMQPHPVVQPNPAYQMAPQPQAVVYGQPPQQQYQGRSCGHTEANI